MPDRHITLPLLRAVYWSPEEGVVGPQQSWAEGAFGAPELSAIDPLLRRRLSPMGKGMLACAARVSEGVGPVRSVFASQHGDPGRTLPVLADLAQGLEASPTQFSMNVHNAIAGIWSIARKDPSPSISLAAGPETFGMGLLEAFAEFHQDPSEPVLYVFGDDELPELLRGFDPRPTPLHALALLIGGPAPRHLTLTRDPARVGPPSPLAQSLHALFHPEHLWQGTTAAWSFEVTG